MTRHVTFHTAGEGPQTAFLRCNFAPLSQLGRRRVYAIPVPYQPLMDVMLVAASIVPSPPPLLSDDRVCAPNGAFIMYVSGCKTTLGSTLGPRGKACPRSRPFRASAPMHVPKWSPSWLATRPTVVFRPTPSKCAQTPDNNRPLKKFKLGVSVEILNSRSASLFSLLYLSLSLARCLSACLPACPTLSAGEHQFVSNIFMLFSQILHRLCQQYTCIHTKHTVGADSARQSV